VEASWISPEVRVALRTGEGKAVNVETAFTQTVAATSASSATGFLPWLPFREKWKIPIGSRARGGSTSAYQDKCQRHPVPVFRI
jgi:hypothetical protein